MADVVKIESLSGANDLGAAFKVTKKSRMSGIEYKDQPWNMSTRSMKEAVTSEIYKGKGQRFIERALKL